MKRNNILAVLAFLTFVMAGLTSCNNDDDKLVSVEKEYGFSISNALFDWDTSKEDLTEQLKDYEIDDTGYYVYVSKKGQPYMLSYQFEDDFLIASVVMVPKEKTNQNEIDRVVRNYEYLGSITEDKDIYVDEDANKILEVQILEIKGVDYIAFGCTPYK